MRLLWIATKSPWPPNDGGRLLLLESLAALRAAGANVTLVAPIEAASRAASEKELRSYCSPRLVAGRGRSRVAAATRSLLTRKPWSIARHDLPAVRAVVEKEAASGTHDLIVAEQLQAFAQATGPAALALPRVLRAQNVESDLWRQLGEASRPPRREWLLGESRRLGAAERAAVSAASLTLALSERDADRLASLAGSQARVEALPPPFPAVLPAGTLRLDGEPPLVLFGSAGWEPNRRAESRFLGEVWPALRAASPGARLHWFGGGGHDSGIAGVSHLPAPQDSRDPLSRGTVLVLPLDIASGVRMRILEAWARGVAVVASPAAASGLRATHGEELLLANGREEYVAAIERLVKEPRLYDALVARGRKRLASDHDPGQFAARFLELAGGLTSPDSADSGKKA